MLVDEKATGEYFEQVISELAEWTSADEMDVPRDRFVKLAANYLLSDLKGILTERSGTIEDTLITPENFAELMKLVAQQKVTSRVAKDVLREMFSTGQDPSDLVEEKGLAQVSDEGEILKAVEQVVSENEQPVQDYRAGKEAVLQFLVGKVMAVTKGRANPKMARELLKKVMEKKG